MVAALPRNEVKTSEYLYINVLLYARWHSETTLLRNWSTRDSSILTAGMHESVLQSPDLREKFITYFGEASPSTLFGFEK
jgi:hypothetical protein